MHLLVSIRSDAPRSNTTYELITSLLVTVPNDSFAHSTSIHKFGRWSQGARSFGQDEQGFVHQEHRAYRSPLQSQLGPEQLGLSQIERFLHSNDQGTCLQTPFVWDRKNDARLLIPILLLTLSTQAITPVSVLLISFGFGLKHPSSRLFGVVSIISLGVGIASWGEVEFDMLGFLIQVSHIVLYACFVTCYSPGHIRE